MSALFIAIGTASFIAIGLRFITRSGAKETVTLRIEE